MCSRSAATVYSWSSLGWLRRIVNFSVPPGYASRPGSSAQAPVSRACGPHRGGFAFAAGLGGVAPGNDVRADDEHRGHGLRD